MVRFASEQGIFFKIWRFILLLWEIFCLFLVSLFKKNPKEARK